VVAVTARTVGIATASVNLFRSIGAAAVGAVFAVHSLQTVKGA
jgi:hypothetical protein